MFILERTGLFEYNGENIERFSRNKCFSASFQSHQCAWYVVKRSEASIDHQDQFELIEYISAAKREL